MKIMKCVAVFALALFLAGTAQCQIVKQDLDSQYQKEQKDLGDGTEIGGPPPQQNFSTLSQEDAETILQAAQALEEYNPELAKKLLHIGK